MKVTVNTVFAQGNGIIKIKVHSDLYNKLEAAKACCFLKKGDPKLESGMDGDYFTLKIKDTESTSLYMNRLYELINEA